MPFDESYGGRVTPFRDYANRAEEQGQEAGETFAQEWWDDDANDDEKDSLIEAVESERHFDKQYALAKELVSFDDVVDDDDLNGESNSLEDDMRFEYPERIDEVREIFKEEAQDGFYRKLIELAEEEDDEESDVDDDEEDDVGGW